MVTSYNVLIEVM